MSWYFASLSVYNSWPGVISSGVSLAMAEAVSWKSPSIPLLLIHPFLLLLYPIFVEKQQCYA